MSFDKLRGKFWTLASILYLYKMNFWHVSWLFRSERLQVTTTCHVAGIAGSVLLIFTLLTSTMPIRFYSFNVNSFYTVKYW